MKRLWGSVAVLALVACSSDIDSIVPAPEAGTDAGVEAGGAAGSQAGADAGTDADSAEAAAGSGGSDDGDADSGDPYGELAAAIAKLRNKHAIPGLVMAVVEDGKDPWTKAVGNNVGATNAVNTTTIFPQWAVGAVVATILNLKLVDEGKLNLDEHVTTYIPELQLAWDPEAWLGTITARHLLANAAGFRRYGISFPLDVTTIDDSGLMEWVASSSFQSTEYLEVVAGSTFALSNTEIRLRAALAEKAGGTPFRTAVKEKILQPLGMSRTFYTTAALAGDPDVAHSGNPMSAADPSSLAAFALLSSIEDGAKFTTFMLQGDATVLSDGMRNAAMSPQGAGTGWEGRCNTGYGLLVQDSYCTVTANYDLGFTTASLLGTALDYSSMIFLVPDKKFGVVLATNTAVSEAVTRDFIAAALKVIGVASLEPDSHPPAPADYGKYVGTYPAHSPTSEPSYAVKLFGQTLHVSSSKHNCNLVAGQMPHTFTCDETPPSDVAFIVDSNDEVQYFEAFESTNPIAAPGDGG
jgi:CubicO group peptidase (beta-lactamase class C family)